MTVEAEVLPPLSQSLEPIERINSDPESVLLNAEVRQAVVARVRELSAVADPDVSTAKGRDLIRAAAASVSRAKAAIDKGRLRLTETYRARVATINQAGKELVAELELIADEVRAPLTKYEQEEKARAERSAQMMAWLRNAALVTINDTAETVKARGSEAFRLEVTPELYGRDAKEVQDLKDQAVATLRAALERLKREEAEKAELEELRRKNAEREAAEQARLAEEQRKREEAEAEERRRREAEEARAAEARRVAEAAEEARREAERQAQSEIEAANARAREAEERAAAIERERRAAEEAEAARVAEEQAEQARRERNAAHRRTIMGQIKADLITAAGLTEEQATMAVKAMVKGTVRHVQVTF